MTFNADHAFDKISLDELIELLVKKTTEYLNLKQQKNADGIQVQELKLEIDRLHSIIALRRLPAREL